jgi:hypothetical protein
VVGSDTAPLEPFETEYVQIGGFGLSRGAAWQIELLGKLARSPQTAGEHHQNSIGMDSPDSTWWFDAGLIAARFSDHLDRVSTRY